MSEAPKPSPLSAPEPWSLVADDYTAELVPMFELFAKDALELGAFEPSALEVGKPAASTRILDVAAGPGTLALLAARAGMKVSAIDFAPQMIENLQRRVDAAGLAVDVRVGDGQALPWEAGSFQAAFSMFGLMFFPDRARGFAELLRVLVPGGVTVVSSWAPFEGVFQTMMGSLREVLPEIAFSAGKGPLGDPDDFATELGAAGFSDVRIVPKTHTLTAPSVADFWRSCERTTAPLVLLKKRLGDAKWSEVTGGVLGRMQAEHGAGSVDIKTTAYLGFGRKPA